jgi:hypothetical protein
MIQGKAFVINKEHSETLEKVYKLLYEKYDQYQEVGIEEICIKIHPQRTIYWKNKNS